MRSLNRWTLLVGLALAGCSETSTPPANSAPSLVDLQASTTSGLAPLPVIFTVNASDPDGDALTYLWEVAQTPVQGAASLSYTFEEPGSYMIEVTVSDGEYMASDSLTVTVDSADGAPPENPDPVDPEPPTDPAPPEEPEPPAPPEEPTPPTDPVEPEPPGEPTPPEEPTPPGPPEEPAPPSEEPTPPDTPTSPSDVYLFGGMNDEVFLGCLSCPASNPNSVYNEYGNFGSEYSSTSISNNYSQYGSPYSTYSACNSYAQNPPAIVDGTGAFLGRLTINDYHPQRYRDVAVREWLDADVCV